MQLTNNFSLAELSKTNVRNVDNTPDKIIINNLKQLAEHILQPLRDAMGKPVTISSGYRSPAVNTAIGGSPTSDHCKGMAADIEIAGVSNYDLANYITKNFKFTQVILEFHTQGVPDSGWVHVSYDPSNLKCQVLTAVKQNGKTVYLQGLQV